MVKSKSIQQAILLCIGCVVVAVQAAPFSSNHINNTTLSNHLRRGPSDDEDDNESEPLSETDPDSDAETSRRMKIPASKHPVSSGDIYLFHGTEDESVAAAIMNSGMQMSDKRGGFNPGKKLTVGGVGGAAYLTDSLIAAAQYVCYNKKTKPTSINKEGVVVKKPPVTEAHVVRFEFEGKGARVKRFKKKDEEWRKFMDMNLKSEWDQRKRKAAYDKGEALFKNTDVIEGPMDAPIVDAKLTPDFWQYAIIKKEWLDTQKLKPVAVYMNIPCKKVPVHPGLTKEMYLEGQYLSKTPSSEFTKLVHTLGTKESTHVSGTREGSSSPSS